MRFLILFFIVVLFKNINAQTIVMPTVGINYSYQFENSFYIPTFDRVFAHEFGLSGGIRIKEHLFIDIGLGVALSDGGVSSSQIRSLTNSLGFNYRILKPKHICSPMIGVNFGYEISSNARGKYVSNKYSGIVNKDNIYADPKFIYNNNVYFGHIKALLDIEYKNISLRTGLNLNISSFDQTTFEYKYGVTNYNKSIRTNVFYMNIGLEAGMLYTFPMKKHAAKKAQEH